MSSARGVLYQGVVVRTIYGLLSLFAPKAIFAPARKWPTAPDTRYFNALFGGRDISIAIATLALVQAGREREAVMLNASCEATDMVSMAQEFRARGEVDGTIAGAIAFNVLGWLSVARAAKALRGGDQPD